MHCRTGLVVAAVGLCLTACATRTGTSAAGTSAASTSAASTTTATAGPATAAAVSPYGPVQKVKSADGRVDGELVGTPAPGAKFSKLRIGMTMNQVLGLVGGPDATSSHETGKRWIPFYFGNDVRRMQVFYKGEGCLSYTGGNAWGSGENELIRITATPRTDCME